MSAPMPCPSLPSRKTYRLWMHKKKKLKESISFPHFPAWIKWSVFTIAVFLILMVFGVFTHIFEKDFVTQFHYPLEVNLQPVITLLKAGEKPPIEPINTFNYSYIKSSKDKCSMNNPPVVLIVVKSAMPHFERRQVIRETWGREQEGILTVFLVGVGSNEDIQSGIDEEDTLYNDIVQSDFLDTYYNNTLKTMSGFKWAFSHCPNSHYVLFSDDDMYISIKNLLTFLKDTSAYPSAPIYIPTRNSKHREILEQTQENVSTASLIQDLRNDNLNETLYAGYVFESAPLRMWMSKWYVSLEEYPYDMWPPYATAGAYVVSRQSLADLYYTSLYTKFFRFDDVFLGLTAMKANIDPLHCPHFYFWKKPYSIEGYRDVIASHGYGDSNELRAVWSQQRDAGHA